MNSKINVDYLIQTNVMSTKNSYTCKIHNDVKFCNTLKCEFKNLSNMKRLFC